MRENRVHAPSLRLRELLAGNVGALSLASLLNDTASEMIYPLLPAFLVGILGAGPAFLGAVEGVAESVASLLKLVGGWVADRTGRRRPLVVTGYGLAGLVRPLLALAVAPWHVLAVRLGDRAGKGIRTAPRDVLLSESAPSDRRGVAFGVHRAADHAGSILGPVAAATLLLLWPGRVRLVFAAALLPALVVLGVLLRGVSETSRSAASPAGEEKLRRPAAAGDAAVPDVDARGGGAGSASESSVDAGGTPTASRAFRLLLAIFVVFALGNASDAFLLLRAQELGIGVAVLPLLWGALHASKMAWSVPGGLLADRFGPARVVIAGWLAYAAVYAGFAAASGSVAVWGLFVGYGLFFGLTESPEKVLVASLARGGEKGRAFGAYHAAIGFTTLPASLVFGLVWQRFGAAPAFALGASLAGLSAFLLLLLRLRLRAVASLGARV